MSQYTREEFEQFRKLVLLGESADQMGRLRSRLELPRFVKEHGQEKCDAMFKAMGEPKEIDQFSLKKPCRHCPFSPAKTAIKFRGRERAEQISETAYRNGFPCHKSAIDAEDRGYVFGPETQHCAGALMMLIYEHPEGWPGIDNDEDRADKIREHMDWRAPHFECEQDFLDANTPKKGKGK